MSEGEGGRAGVITLMLPPGLLFVILVGVAIWFGDTQDVLLVMVWQFLYFAIVAFTLTSWWLLLASSTTFKNATRPYHQIAGLIVSTLLGLVMLWFAAETLGFTFASTSHHSSQIVQVALGVLVTFLVAFTTFGLVFTLLLAFVVGREPPLEEFDLSKE